MTNTIWKPAICDKVALAEVAKNMIGMYNDDPTKSNQPSLAAAERNLEMILKGLLFMTDFSEINPEGIIILYVQREKSSRYYGIMGIPDLKEVTVVLDFVPKIGNLDTDLSYGRVDNNNIYKYPELFTGIMALNASDHLRRMRDEDMRATYGINIDTEDNVEILTCLSKAQDWLEAIAPYYQHPPKMELPILNNRT